MDRLSQHPALSLRNDVLLPAWTPSNTGGYDPNVQPGTTDANGNDGLSMNQGWFNSNGFSLHVALTNHTGGVQGGGTTGVSGIKADGTGVVQDRDDTLLVTVFAEHDQSYNGERPADIASMIAGEIESIVLDNTQGGGSEFNRLSASPFTQSTDTEPSTPVEMSQSAVGFGWQKD